MKSKYGIEKVASARISVKELYSSARYWRARNSERDGFERI
jgi:hypothetical protein